MESISSIPGKLFYTVYQMYKEKNVDQRGKIILKDLIIMNNTQVESAYKNYVKDGTELTLRGDLLRILKNQSTFPIIFSSLSGVSRKSRGKITVKIPEKRIQAIPASIRDTS